MRRRHHGLAIAEQANPTLRRIGSACPGLVNRIGRNGRRRSAIDHSRHASAVKWEIVFGRGSQEEVSKPVPIEISSRSHIISKTIEWRGPFEHKRSKTDGCWSIG